MWILLHYPSFYNCLMWAQLLSSLCKWGNCFRKVKELTEGHTANMCLSCPANNNLTASRIAGLPLCLAHVCACAHTHRGLYTQLCANSGLEALKATGQVHRAPAGCHEKSLHKGGPWRQALGGPERCTRDPEFQHQHHQKTEIIDAQILILIYTLSREGSYSFVFLHFKCIFLIGVQHTNIEVHRL